MTYFPKNNRYSPFNELMTAERESIFNFNPTWGVSQLREITTTSGTGTAITEDSGEIKLSTGTATNNVVETKTRERGQYHSGITGECGIGMRIPTTPSGSQDVKWGYFDDENGFGFGYDSTSPYVFYRKNSSTTKIHQKDWNVDKMDGKGPSGLNLDAANGVIYQILFTWYGYGTIFWYVFLENDENDSEKDLFIVHQYTPSNEASVYDPNQPIKVRAENGSNTSSNLDIYVGGRQFNLVKGSFIPQSRQVSEIITSYSIDGTQGKYTPVIALRPKQTFGPSGRTNSIRVVTKNIEIQTAQKIDFRLVTQASTNLSSSDWGDPTGWSSDETAVETVTADNTSFTASGGFVVERGLLSGGDISDQETNFDIVLGPNEEVVLEIGNRSGSSTEITAIVKWEEQW